MVVNEDSTEQVDTLNIQSMLTRDEKILRKMLLNKLIEAERPVFLEDIEFEGKKAIIKSLSDKGLIVTNEDGSISALYPVSAAPTRHKVQLGDGRSLYAMCAIDSLGIAYEFDQNLVISSSCSQCRAVISIIVADGKLSSFKPLTTHALHLPLDEYKNWATTC